MSLSRTDTELLELLAGDSRMPNNTLANKLGLANSTTLTKVRSLIERGIIKRFTVEVDYAKLGRGVQAIIAITLKSHQESHVLDIQNRLLRQPEVIQIFHTSGNEDFLVHVAVTDSDALRDFILRSITADAVVRQVQTHLLFGHMRSKLG
jgi:DNA-binding Lrp family transcriptional regulator